MDIIDLGKANDSSVFEHCVRNLGLNLSHGVLLTSFELKKLVIAGGNHSVESGSGTLLVEMSY